MSMKKLIGFLSLALLLVAGCDTGPEGPTEASLKEMMVGDYCSVDANHRLGLKADGRYVNKRVRRNPFGGAGLVESCEGVYRFEQQGEAWKLIFEKSDKKSNPMVRSCEGEVEVWNPEKGYVVGDSVIILADLFDQATVANNNCGGNP